MKKMRKTPKKKTKKGISGRFEFKIPLRTNNWLFCTKNNFNSLPTNPKILALYLTHLSQTFKFSTLKRRIASISVVNKLKGN